ncbi:phosphatidylserine decarboxylase 1 [Coniosporium tulheliwenetii]|uniref:Phosphatidylserine decarboxylase 1 n=1 Tax=Coniosporium tulheliwenetii TaxID=3383036 RepID=A0ACC2YSF1_9PEZI|nr:phosphatidylserine decarboxylase 1 [Cladosporium sp. JES 115]
MTTLHLTRPHLAVRSARQMAHHEACCVARRIAPRNASFFAHQPSRRFSASRNRLQQQQQQQHRKESFGSRLRAALRSTKVEWKPIPVGLGIASLGVLQFYRIQRREQARQQEEEEARQAAGGDGGQDGGKPKKRQRVRPTGPWSVQIMSTLPLKALSRLWGRFNELEIPYYLRVPGFKLYSFIFGVNLAEVSEPDLHAYPNLASFFYRTLKPGVRPLDPNPHAVLSPADGKVIQFGTIEHGEVEQVKGVTYSLDALLGSQKPKTSGTSTPSGNTTPDTNIASSPQSPQPSSDRSKDGSAEIIKDDEEFAQSEVRADLALRASEQPWWAPSFTKTPTALYYCVIYLAPGDYHRFHSPVSWVVESRRHFAGELYSVSPYLQRTLPGLFTLNERVVLLGRWRWGFFSYTPVGATNVGSIVINFDKELRTNSLLTDTAADRAAEEAARRGSLILRIRLPLLRGHALKRGEEMGGFQLGSTIVLVFEAPKSQRPSFDEGYQEGKREGPSWEWNIEPGQHVKVGQALGQVVGV